MYLRVSGTGCCLGPGLVPDIFPGVASRGAVYLQVTSQLLKLSLTRLSRAQRGPAVGLSACPVPHGASQQTTIPMLGAVISCNRLLLKTLVTAEKKNKNKKTESCKMLTDVIFVLLNVGFLGAGPFSQNSIMLLRAFQLLHAPLWPPRCHAGGWRGRCSVAHLHH